MLEIPPSQSGATIFVTHAPCNLALDAQTTTPHHMSGGYPDGPPKF